MGSAGVDIMLSAIAREVFPFSVEAKNTKTFPSVAALEQSKANAYNHTTPCVVWKPPRKGMDDSIIYFNFNDFVNLWKELNEPRGEI